ncbi:MAG: NAD-dependent epimerase/dehydratase family protein, partial [Christensenellales bacterium]
MRYVITGGTGHIGNTLTRLIRKREPDSVIRLLLLPGEDTTIFRDVEGIGFAYGDVLDRDFLMREIEPDDVVFHLAGIIDISSENKDRLYEVNVRGV